MVGWLIEKEYRASNHVASSACFIVGHSCFLRQRWYLCSWVIPLAIRIKRLSVQAGSEVYRRRTFISRVGYPDRASRVGLHAHSMRVSEFMVRVRQRSGPVSLKGLHPVFHSLLATEFLSFLFQNYQNGSFKGCFYIHERIRGRTQRTHPSIHRQHLQTAEPTTHQS